MADYSENSVHYVVGDILVDRPQDQSNRWSGATTTKHEKMLCLETLAVFSRAPFFSRAHTLGFVEGDWTCLLTT